LAALERPALDGEEGLGAREDALAGMRRSGVLVVDRLRLEFESDEPLVAADAVTTPPQRRLGRMTDVWATVAELDESTQRRMADVLETRGADSRQREMRRAFLAEIEFPDDAELLEVGCGTGVLTRVLAGLDQVESVVGVDLALSLLERARVLAAGLPNTRFEVADARALPFADATFDVVIFDSTLSHVPEPERALAEAARVLRSGGVLAAFDGDYATTTVSLDVHDPLQVCVEAMMASSVHDRRVTRRLPTLLRDAGFEPRQSRSHGYVETGDGSYMQTVIERGADMLVATGTIGTDLAAALKNEARQRADAGRFFGHIAYRSVIASKRGEGHHVRSSRAIH
jgi:ubiquinone/menaquinone biosynthesis C-methylase UbiE